jgi:hypothetical protein
MFLLAYFGGTYFVQICAQIIILSVVHYEAVNNHRWREYGWTLALDCCITITFSSEIICQLCARGPARYFNNKWRVLDLLIAAVSLVADLTSIMRFHDEQVSNDAVDGIKMLRTAVQVCRIPRFFGHIRSLSYNLALNDIPDMVKASAKKLAAARFLCYFFLSVFIQQFVALLTIIVLEYTTTRSATTCWNSSENHALVTVDCAVSVLLLIEVYSRWLSEGCSRYFLGGREGRALVAVVHCLDFVRTTSSSSL